MMYVFKTYIYYLKTLSDIRDTLSGLNNSFLSLYYGTIRKVSA